VNVLALTKYDRLGASSRVRTLQYLPCLESEGIDVAVRPLLTDDYLRRRYAGDPPGFRFVVERYARRLAQMWVARQYDLVWIEKELLPWMPAILERALLLGTPYVVDYDDALFHNYDQHRSSLVRRLMGDKIDRVMRGAALVVAGNDYLAQRARTSGAPNVAVLPSVVDLKRYGPLLPPPSGPFTVGWIGSPGSERLLEHIRGVLVEVVSEPNTRLVLVGATERALPDVPHETWSWGEDDEVRQMQQFHVGIMPLADTPWERGKCGYKLIQCMGVGRPVVASPIGVNARIVANGETGFLAESGEHWLRALNTLGRDPELTSRMGQAGRRVVEDRYSLAVTAPRLAELLRNAVRGALSAARA